MRIMKLSIIFTHTFKKAKKSHKQVGQLISRGTTKEIFKFMKQCRWLKNVHMVEYAQEENPFIRTLFLLKSTYDYSTGGEVILYRILLKSNYFFCLIDATTFAFNKHGF